MLWVSEILTLLLRILLGDREEGPFCPSFSCVPGLAFPAAHFFGAGDHGDAIYTQRLLSAACVCERDLLS